MLRNHELTHFLFGHWCLRHLNVWLKSLQFLFHVAFSNKIAKHLNTTKDSLKGTNLFFCRHAQEVIFFCKKAEIGRARTCEFGIDQLKSRNRFSDQLNVRNRNNWPIVGVKRSHVYHSMSWFLIYFTEVTNTFRLE